MTDQLPQLQVERARLRTRRAAPGLTLHHQLRHSDRAPGPAAGADRRWNRGDRGMCRGHRTRVLLRDQRRCGDCHSATTSCRRFWTDLRPIWLDHAKSWAWVRGHHMAKAAVEMALLDQAGRASGQSLSKILGGVRSRIRCGVSIGIQPSVAATLSAVEGYLDEGYQRIKLKCKPGYDVELARAVRQRFPATPVMLDANSAYSLKDLDQLRALDEYDLMMIEQPLAHDDLIDHAALQCQIETSICLDESVESLSRSPSGYLPGFGSDPQHQGRSGGRSALVGPDPRHLRRGGLAGLVRRDAGDRDRPRGQSGTGIPARLHPPRRYLGQRPLLRTGFAPATVRTGPRTAPWQYRPTRGSESRSTRSGSTRSPSTGRSLAPSLNCPGLPPRD